MTKNNKYILELINNNYSINEIINETGLTYKQLFYRLFQLKNDGLEFKKKYYSNGEIYFETKTSKDITDKKEQTKSNTVDLITRKNDNSLNALVISDLHKCNANEEFNVMDNIYEYAIKNNINIILNCGDLIEGMGSIGGEPTIKNIDKQIDNLLKNYPYDKNIISFTVLGNHDLHPLIKNGQDFKTILENRRPDIIPIGYRQGIINIKEDKIVMTHPIDNMTCEYTKSPIMLFGHSHRYEVKDTLNSISIHVPSLSNIKYYKDKFYSPEALDITFKFSNKYIGAIECKQLLINEKETLTISESSYQLSNQKNKNQGCKNLEVQDYPKQKVRVKE